MGGFRATGNTRTIENIQINNRSPPALAGILIPTNLLKALDKLFNILYTINTYS